MNGVRPAETRPALAPGSVLAGYRLEEPLGAGGSGTVWRARRGRTGPIVAVKCLHSSGSTNLGAEAVALLCLDHPHVVRVFDVVEDDGEVAIVMQHCDGGSLADLLAERGVLEPGHVVAVAAPVADALASAHRRGVVHGDVTAGNVLFTFDGEPLLSDFGLARWTRAGPTAVVAAGTPGYAAPEVVAGAAADERADIFGLGALCHEALTGFVPDEDPAGPRLVGRPGVPPPLAEVVDRATAPWPDDRFPTAEGAAAALRAAVDAAHVRLPGPSRRRHGPPPAGAGGGRSWGASIRLTRTFGPRPPAPSLAHACSRRRLVVAAAILLGLGASGGAVAAGVMEPGAGPVPAPAPCPRPPRPSVPSGAAVVAGDPDGDGCDGWAVYDRQVLSVSLSPTDLAPHRYHVGRPGDIALLGDWDCDRLDTPAMYRPRTGEVFLFDDWDFTGGGLPPTAVAMAAVAGRATVERDGRCDEVVVSPGHA